MTKLHEILAIEGDLDATAKKVVEEAIVTFTKKPDHFQEMHRALNMLDENRQGENVEESKAMVTTVADKLDHVQHHVAKYFDIFARKEATNQVATADLVVEGIVIAERVPATLLLGLESKLKNLRNLYEAIPTLAPGIDWRHDATRGADVYKAADADVRMKTEKVIQHKVLVEPTDKHPAQVEKWTADVPVGKIVVNQWSGMLSPAEKSEVLGRIDTLIRAVKQARQRANTVEISDIAIGEKLFEFING